MGLMPHRLRLIAWVTPKTAVSSLAYLVQPPVGLPLLLPACWHLSSQLNHDSVCALQCGGSSMACTFQTSSAAMTPQVRVQTPPEMSSLRCKRVVASPVAYLCVAAAVRLCLLCLITSTLQLSPTTNW